ncbi:MAG: SprT-like domain-containing protein [Bacteroidia bacterium]|nr:SprT-like domain-containing protein [Bacteroidia bacterium]NNJ55570.1 ImmA/IrrE family metallo-endopeptidase [Bacteroidia bacterium]
MEALDYLKTHLPDQKALNIVDYLIENRCNLKFTRPRKTKRGDFRVKGQNLTITVNQDQNSYRLLFTLVHEIAHLKTHHDFGKKVKPHGLEWKNNFRLLFALFGMEEEFLRSPLIAQATLFELQNPKASSGVSLELENAFRTKDMKTTILLNELPIGSKFLFKNTPYQKVENRRTRAVCLNLSNNRRYTINKAAPVLNVEG